MLHPSRIFFYGCLAFCGGVFVVGIARMPEYALLAALGVGGVIAATSPRKHLPLAISVAACTLGMIRITDVAAVWEQRRTTFVEMASMRSESRIIATVAKRERLQNSTLYTLERIEFSSVDKVRENQAAIISLPTHRWQMLYTGGQNFYAGERVAVHGAKFDASGEHEAFLKRDGAAGSIAFPKSITSLGNECGTLLENSACARYHLTEWLTRIREAFENRLRAVLPEPEASLEAGLLIGSRVGLPQELKEALKRTGLSHIVAVSGYNVTIITLAVSTFLGYLLLRRKTVFWISAAFLVLFTLLTGASASVVRASVMGFLVILASRVSRLYSARVAISFAGAAMLFQNPMLVRHDLGFVLSFLATIGLLVLYPLLEERFSRFRAFAGMKNIALQSVSAQLFVLPLIVIAFGSLPVLFLIANMLVLPLIPPAMFFGFFGGIAGFLGDGVGRIVAFPALVLLRFILGVVSVIGALPFASVAVVSSWVRWGIGAGVAAGTVWLVWRLRNQQRRILP